MPATAEPPATVTQSAAQPSSDPPAQEGSLGKAYAIALEKQEKAAKAELPEKTEPAKAAKEDKPESVKPREPKAESKPESKAKSPLDALLGDKPAEDKKPATPAVEEIPADAPVKQLREAYERQKSEAVHLKAELAKRTAPDPAIKSQLETLQRERDSTKEENAKLRDAITALNVEYDPEYRAKFVDGRKLAIDKAAGKLKAFGGNPEALAEALSMPDGRGRSTAIKEALSELDQDDRVKVMAAIERVEALEEEAAELRGDPQKAWARMTQRQQEAAQQANEAAEKNKNTIFERVLKDLPEKAKLLTFVDSEVEGADDWNKGISEAHTSGRHLLSPEATLEEIAAAAVKGARYDFVEGLLLEERRTARAEISELREQLSKYESAEPGFTGKSKTPSTDKLDVPMGKVWRDAMAKSRGEEI